MTLKQQWLRQVLKVNYVAVGPTDVLKCSKYIYFIISVQV